MIATGSAPGRSSPRQKIAAQQRPLADEAEPLAVIQVPRASSGNPRSSLMFIVSSRYAAMAVNVRLWSRQSWSSPWRHVDPPAGID